MAYIYDEPDELTDALHDAVKAEREQCCKDICPHCAGKTAGVPTIAEDVGPLRYIPNSGELSGWCHKAEWGVMFQCLAAAIRARGE